MARGDRDGVPAAQRASPHREAAAVDSRKSGGCRKSTMIGYAAPHGFMAMPIVRCREMSATHAIWTAVVGPLGAVGRSARLWSAYQGRNMLHWCNFPRWPRRGLIVAADDVTLDCRVSAVRC